MSNKILGNAQAMCAYCKFGTLTPDKKQVLCPKKGILDKSFSCKKYIYDPLKRVPEKKAVLPQYSEEDFKL